MSSLTVPIPPDLSPACRAGNTVRCTVPAALASSLYQEAAAALDRRRFGPLGRLVSVNGRMAHLLEAGKGPAVVIVPALGSGVLSWEQFQRELAAEMRVVVYDRAGWAAEAVHQKCAGNSAERGDHRAPGI